MHNFEFLSIFTFPFLHWFSPKISLTRTISLFSCRTLKCSSELPSVMTAHSEQLNFMSWGECMVGFFFSAPCKRKTAGTAEAEKGHLTSSVNFYSFRRVFLSVICKRRTSISSKASRWSLIYSRYEGAQLHRMPFLAEKFKKRENSPLCIFLLAAYCLNNQIFTMWQTSLTAIFQYPFLWYTVINYFKVLESTELTYPKHLKSFWFPIVHGRMADMLKIKFHWRFGERVSDS